MTIFSIFKQCLLAMIISNVAAYAFSESDSAAIGVLKSRHHMVEMYTSDNGSLYTVKDLQGNILAELVTDSELLSQFPELESVIHGYADDASLSPQKTNTMELLKGKDY